MIDTKMSEIFNFLNFVEESQKRVIEDSKSSIWKLK